MLSLVRRGSFLEEEGFGLGGGAGGVLGIAMRARIDAIEQQQAAGARLLARKLQGDGVNRSQPHGVIAAVALPTKQPASIFGARHLQPQAAAIAVPPGLHCPLHPPHSQRHFSGSFRRAPTATGKTTGCADNTLRTMSEHGDTFTSG